MGKLFDKLNKLNEEEEEEVTPIEKYLKDKGFYEATMNPRFMNGYCYENLTTDKSCLRYDMDVNDDYTLRIFINEIEIYYEVETPYRSYQTSDRYDANDYPDVDDIDSLLDEILNNVLD